MSTLLEAQMFSQELIRRIGEAEDAFDLVGIPLSLANAIHNHFDTLGIEIPWYEATKGIEAKRAGHFKTMIMRGPTPNTGFILDGSGKEAFLDFKTFLSGFALAASQIANKYVEGNK